jgi:hypothetical protein
MPESLSYEGKVLHAALDEDQKEVARLVKEMLPGERRALLRACRLLERHLETIRISPIAD